MTLEGVFDVVLYGALLALCGWAAAEDWRRRTVPDAALIGLGVVLVAVLAPELAGGFDPGMIVTRIAAGAAALCAALALFAFRQVDLSDVKFLAVAALFAGMEQLGLLAVVTGLAGGALGAFALATKPKASATGEVAARPATVAYGVAIALGTAAAAAASGLFDFTG